MHPDTDELLMCVEGSIEIPEETAPGRLTVHIGSALSVQRTEETAEPVLPRDLDQLIRAQRMSEESTGLAIEFDPEDEV